MPEGLSEVEYRVLNELIHDSREPTARLAKKLGLSRNTVSKVIRGLVRRGVIRRFTVEVSEEYSGGSIVALIMNEKPTKLDRFNEVYELIDGKFLGVAKVADMNELEFLIKENGASQTQFFISNKRMWRRDSTSITPSELHCDYCGGLIKGEPLTARYHNRTYYFCCSNCLGDFRKKQRSQSN
ncbi:hypothetical protein GCM10007981_02830 [Thermocladium modestius]|uniref:HTH asnC-type domain-containing protein n=1 Tax=Thermocladium modestius TaxID=62609 RepID=A0A830GVZ3_9CREN|nr:TRASH domain-containing protein [Thermocladium modestius]GGP19380.1 hypothetical protein GCM10007981_02830 [Thermocladium modestius]